MNGFRRPLGRVAFAPSPFPSHAPLALLRPSPVHQKRLSSTTPSSSSSSPEPEPHIHPNINPPPTTRPPRLDVPSRSQAPSTFRYLVGVGKAYINFYKSGLGAVLTNRKDILARIESLPIDERPKLYSPRHPQTPPPSTFTRSDWVLLWRVRRDLARIPLFATVLMITGEFTPLLVPWLDPIIPGTCRIPGQVHGALETAERRRADAFDALDGGSSSKLSRTGAREHVLQSLHLTSRLWDLFRLLVPTAALWRIGAGGARIAFLEGDDALLVRSKEGVSALVPDEVRIACAERGIDVLGRKDGELRTLLGDWLRLTGAAEGSERRRRIAVLLTLRPEEWPLTREFALPEWEL